MQQSLKLTLGSLVALFVLLGTKGESSAAPPAPYSAIATGIASGAVPTLPRGAGDKKGRKDEDDDKGKKAETKKAKKGEDDEDDDKKSVKLPKPVAEAVKAKFPGGTVMGVEKEEEDGDTVYEVKLRYKSGSLEVSLTPKGSVLKVKMKGGDEDDDDKGKNKGKGKQDDDDKVKSSGFQGEQKGDHQDGEKKGDDKKGKGKNGDRD